VSAAVAADTIDALAIAMVVVGVALVWTRWPRHAVALVALQSLLLAGVGLTAAIYTGREHLFVGAGLVLGVKAVALPGLIAVLITRTRAVGEMPSAVPRSVAVAAGALVSLLTIEMLGGDPFQTPLGAARALPSAFALILLGIQTMVTRHHAIGQITGFLAIENGMSLAALTATYGMPLVIESGVLLDLLLAVMVAFVYSRRLHEAHGELLTRVFRELRG
jgi:hydrogenase-4 component E